MGITVLNLLLERIFKILTTQIIVMHVYSLFSSLVVYSATRKGMARLKYCDYEHYNIATLRQDLGIF